LPALKFFSKIIIFLFSLFSAAWIAAKRPAGPAPAMIRSKLIFIYSFSILIKNYDYL
jgi:hypothetical protein